MQFENDNMLYLYLTLSTHIHIVRIKIVMKIYLPYSQFCVFVLRHIMKNILP